MTIGGTPPVGARPAAPAASPPARRAAAQTATPAAPAVATPEQSELWEALTAEERAFFLQRALAGPATYGLARPVAVPGAPLGGHLDVRG